MENLEKTRTLVTNWAISNKVDYNAHRTPTTLSSTPPNFIKL